MSIYEEIRDDMYNLKIGNTPLFNFNNNIYSKLEYYNEFGSIKSRAAFFMIDYAIKTGKLTKNKTIIEASSGNTGIAMSGISRMLGYKTKIVIPEGASNVTKRILEEAGADLVLTQGNSTENSIKFVEEMIRKYPDKYIQLKQHDNILNSMAHYYSTGPEVYNEIGNVDFVVAGIGTGGTITGLAKYFKENSNSKVIGVIPEKNSHILGLRNPFNSSEKGIIDKYGKYIDEIYEINENDAYKAAQKLKEKYNLFCRPLVGC